MKTKILLSFLLLCLFGISMAAEQQTIQPLDKIVAIVNSEVVTESELNKQINQAMQQLQSAGAPIPDAAKLRSLMLDQLIDQKMVLLLAKRNNITISDEQLNKGIAVIAARNNLSIDQFKIAMQKQGMDYDVFRKQLRTQMLIQSIEERALGPQLQVTPSEIKAFLKQQTSNNSNPQQYQIMDYLLSPEAAKQPGAVLAQLQKNTSTPTGVTANNLGWRNLNDLPQIFSQKITLMKINDIAGPIQAPNGIHFIKLIGVQGAQQKLTEEQARQILMQRKFAEKVKPWLQQLRSTAYVKIM